MGRQKKVGDVYSVQLPDDNYAFGRVINDNGFEVFEGTNSSGEFDSNPTPQRAFVVALSLPSFKDERMQFIANAPFANEQEKQRPKTYIYDMIRDSYTQYDSTSGQTTPTTKEACKDLEPTTAWSLSHLIDRITGKVDWLKVMKDNEKPFSSVRSQSQ